MKPSLYSIAFAALALVIMVTLDGSLKEYSKAARYESMLEAAVRAGTDAATAMLHPLGSEAVYTEEELAGICEIFEEVMYASLGGSTVPSEEGKENAFCRILSSMEMIILAEEGEYVCTRAETTMSTNTAGQWLPVYDEALGRRAATVPGFVVLFHGKPVTGINYYEVEVSSDARLIDRVPEE